MSLLSHNLQAFLAVKTYLTVGSAAVKLRLTQAAVTIRIQNLERDLSTQLFIRSRRGMKVTPAGEVLARYCQRALELEAETMPDFSSPQAAMAPVHWVIQGPSTSMRTRVIAPSTDFLTRYPDVSLGFHIADLESGVERLKNGSTDLLIAERGQIGKEFDSKILKAERYILVATSAWKNRAVEEIVATERIIDFDPSDVMTHRFLEKHGLRKKCRQDRHFVNSTEFIADLVISGLGYSVLSEEFSMPFIKKGLLVNLCPDKFFDYKLALAWYPRKQMPNSFRDLVKLIK